MKELKNIFYIAALATLLASCIANTSDTKTDSDEFDDMFDSAVTSETPQKANSIITKAFNEKRITEGQYGYLNAVVVFKNFMRFDSVLTMCQPLLETHEVKTDDKLRYRIYALMANAAEGSASYADMIKYASETVKLAHKLGKIDKEQEMRGTVGYGIVLLGKSPEGLRMINSGLAALEKRTEWNCMNSYIILSKIKIAALDEINDFNGIQKTCNIVLRRIERMKNHPEEITAMPKEWANNKEAFAQAIDFYRSQILAYNTYSYAKLGEKEKAEESLKEFDNTAYSKTLDAKRVIVPALGELGLYGRMLSTYDEIDKSCGSDTITTAYSQELQYRAKAASSTGDYALARRYLRRTIFLNDSLHTKTDQEQMARMLSLYKVHEEQLKASNAKSAAKLMLIIIVALLVITLISMVLAYRILRQNKQMKIKNKSMVDIIDWAYKYRAEYVKQLQQNDKKHDETDKNNIAQPIQPSSEAQINNEESDEDKHLFLLIDQKMSEGKAYLDSDFQRQTLVDELHIDRNKIGRLIREYSGYPNLSAYISSYRLKHAYDLLSNGDTKMTIDMVSKESGFTTVRTFQRLFKEAYGMTPIEFREAKQR